MNISGEKFVKIFGKGHAQFLSKQIADCFEKECYANVKFICKNNVTRGSSSLSANKFILAAASKKFYNLLAGTDDEEVTILVPDENFSTLKLLLQYIYSGEIFLNELSDELNLLIDEWDIVSPEVDMVVEIHSRRQTEDVTTSRPRKIKANSNKSNLPSSRLCVTTEETVSSSPSADKTNNLSNHSAVELTDITTSDTRAENDFVEAPNQIPKSSIPSKSKAVKKVKSPDESSNGYVFLAAYKKKVGDQLGRNPIPTCTKPKRVKESKTRNVTPVEPPQSEALVIPDEKSNAKPKRKQATVQKDDTPKKRKVAVEIEENGLSENEEVDEEDKQDLSQALKFVDEEIKRRKSLTEEARDLADTVRRYKVYAKFFLESGALKTVEEKVTRIPCSTCGKMIHRDYIATHMKAVHSTEKPYLCELCGKTFTIPELLRSHVRNNHPDESKIKVHQCSVCDKEFKKAHYLKRHMTLHQGIRPHSCPYCDKTFRMRSVLVKHKRTHTGEKPYQCDVCKRCFSARFNYVAHLRTHSARATLELDGFQLSSFIDPETRLFKCDVCGTTFHQELAFMVHKAGHTTEKPKLPCRYCPETFGTIKTLKSHIQGMHAEVLLRCELCPDKMFKTKSSLSNHMLLHTQAKQYVCTVCQKDFHSKLQLDTHFECVHLNRRPYACRFCDKRFKQKITMRGHERIHTDERPFKCIHCPKSFRHDSHLQNHTRLHTGEKPFVCPHCNKAFSNKNNLSIHIKIHTGEKNECATCKKVFRTITKLREHEKSHETSPEQELVEESTSDCNEK